MYLYITSYFNNIKKYQTVQVKLYFRKLLSNIRKNSNILIKNIKLKK